MKKNVIALSAVAALLSMAGAANAAVVPAADATATDAAGVVAGGAVVAADTTEVNARGLGHKLVFPYFTTQGSNNTLVNIVNTDTRNGKALKVRFRGAGNSDDLFDFQVLMSPGDVWTASLTQGADGVTRLTTTDNTCVIPSKAAINVAFSNTNRLDPSKDIANQTREGYIEVINMADIPPGIITATGSTVTTTNALFSVVKHNSSGVATCDSTATGVAVLERLKTNVAATTTAADNVVALNAIGLTFPTTGLAGDWVILNTESQAAWSGSALALEARDGANGPAATANAVFFPQLPTRVVTVAPADTTDPLLTSGVVTPLLFDFPDMSTSYASAANTAVSQRNATTAALETAYIANEWNSDAAIGGSTDMLFSQPMRRYWAAVNYKATGASGSSASNTTGTVAAPLFASDATPNPYSSDNTVMADRLLCIADVQLTQYDREERTTTSGFVVSPGVATQLNICGEAAVTSINAGGVDAASALEASVARNDVTLAYDKDGWLSVGFGTTTPGGTTLKEFPIIGASFLKVSNAVQSYGFAFPHKTK